jgi:hypothetical protein
MQLPVVQYSTMHVFGDGYLNVNEIGTKWQFEVANGRMIYWNCSSDFLFGVVDLVRGLATRGDYIRVCQLRLMRDNFN